MDLMCHCAAPSMNPGACYRCPRYREYMSARKDFEQDMESFPKRSLTHDYLYPKWEVNYYV